MATIRRITVAAVGCLSIAVPVCSAVPASAATDPQYAVQLAEARQAAQLAAAQGYRTGIAVLDLANGDYSGAGDDAGLFPSESVAKVLIATELLLTGRMRGTDEALARAMITTSDDAAADVLYPRAGGDDLLPRVASHYGITGLGAPPTTPGWWGLTQISARGLVQLYAALQHDPAVQPWLSDAMAHASPVAADGTQQFFGLPAAVPGSAIKQGWGHESVSGTQAVANSTGYVAGHLAVAILTQGPPASYLAGITAVVTAQAQALLAGVAPAAAPPPTATAAPVEVGPATPQRGSRDLLRVLAAVAGVGAAGYGGLLLARRTRTGLRARRERKRVRRAEQRRRRALAAAARSGATVVRLSDGSLVRLTGRRPAGSRARPAVARGHTSVARPRPVRTREPAAARAA